MRGTKAKEMRRYTRYRFPFLATTTEYRPTPDGGGVLLSQRCQRAVYQMLKAAYKKAKKANTTKWRKYSNDRNRSSNHA